MPVYNNQDRFAPTKKPTNLFAPGKKESAPSTLSLSEQLDAAQAAKKAKAAGM